MANAHGRTSAGVLKQGFLNFVDPNTELEGRCYFVLKKCGTLVWATTPSSPAICSLRITSKTNYTSLSLGFEILTSTTSLIILERGSPEYGNWVLALKYIIQAGPRTRLQAPSEPAVINGTVFDITTKYRPLKVIGQGAFGVVLSAMSLKTGEYVAIKKIQNAFSDLVDAKRFLREVQLMKHLRHPNLLNFVDIMVPLHVQNFCDIYLVTGLMQSNLYRIIRSKQALSEAHLKCFMYQVDF